MLYFYLSHCSSPPLPRRPKSSKERVRCRNCLRSPAGRAHSLARPRAAAAAALLFVVMLSFHLLTKRIQQMCLSVEKWSELSLSDTELQCAAENKKTRQDLISHSSSLPGELYCATNTVLTTNKQEKKNKQTKGTFFAEACSKYTACRFHKKSAWIQLK